MSDKILKLTLHGRYFWAIVNGEKKHEYRTVKPYWYKLVNEKYQYIEFTNGYGRHRPRIVVKMKGLKIGKLFNEITGQYEHMFIISLGKIVEKSNF